MNIQGVLHTIASNLPQILLALLVFGILIFIHELGHFLTAKWAKIRVNEFAMGMGPAIWTKQKGETLYALRLFPIGGFCALEGDDTESDDSHAFGRAPLYKRMIVMLAGSFMNLLLGLIILGFLTVQHGVGTATIGAFHEAAVTNEWLQVNDTIRKINNHRVRTDNDVYYELSRDRDGIMDIEVLRQNPDGTADTVTLKSVQFGMRTVENNLQIIAVDFSVYGISNPTVPQIITNSFNWTVSVVRQVWGSFADLLTGRYSVNQLSGFVDVTRVIGDAAKTAAESPDKNWSPFIILVAVITLNLGVFNLLPLPALDGGRLVFLLIELVRRKPMNPKYEGYVHGVGFVLLIGLMIFVTVNDVAKLIK